LGGELRRSHLAAMPDLWMRFDRRPRTSPQAGARCTPRLDRDSARSLPRCGKTFTFLPLFSLPYTHYSMLRRCQALRRRSVEHCSWEEATPTLKDPNRVPDSSTLRRWAHGLDCSQPAFSFLRQTLIRVTQWLAPGVPADHQAEPLSWLTPVLQVLWPLRL
jgi:hypothetical protein